MITLILSYLPCDPTAVVEKLGIEVGAGKVIGKEKFAGKVVVAPAEPAMEKI